RRPRPGSSRRRSRAGPGSAVHLPGSPSPGPPGPGRNRDRRSAQRRGRRRWTGPPPSGPRTAPPADPPRRRSACDAQGRHTRTFFWEDLPAALFEARWAVVLSTVVFLVAALISGLYFGLDPVAREMVIPEGAQRSLAQRDFVSYYFQGEASGFAAQVWTDNAWITVQSVVFGVTGIWPMFMLLQNGLNIGLSAGVMGAYGGLGTFFVYILPHGLLELTCLFVGAGAGLRTFWAWVRPGS